MRAAALQGQWYPMPQQLRVMLDQNYAYKPKDDLLFLISPHAGLSYCVSVQGAAFSAINPALYMHVVILAVTHRFHLHGLGETPFKQWANPLEASKPLRMRHLGFKQVDPRACQAEHSAEVLMPYLARVFEQQLDSVDFSVVYCGRTATQSELAQLPFASDTLYVISSDFCHYGQNFDYTVVLQGKSADETIDAINMEAVKGISQGSAEFVAAQTRYENTICGRHTIETGLKLMETHTKYSTELLKYSKSGFIKRAGDSSVSYVGLIGFAGKPEQREL